MSVRDFNVQTRALATVRAASYNGPVHLFVYLSVAKTQNAIFSKTKKFRAMVVVDDLQEVVQWLFKEPIIGPIKSEMAEIRHFDNRHKVTFFC